MGFKIESMSTMAAIPQRIDERVSESEQSKNRAIAALNDLSSSISGNGVEKSLNDLNNAVSTCVKDIAAALQAASTFINEQVSGYVSNEQDLARGLGDVRSLLDDINF